MRQQSVFRWNVSQCEFAFYEVGNKLTEEDQWAKLALVKEIAEEVWAHKYPLNREVVSFCIKRIKLRTDVLHRYAVFDRKLFL